MEPVLKGRVSVIRSELGNEDGDSVRRVSSEGDRGNGGCERMTQAIRDGAAAEAIF